MTIAEQIETAAKRLKENGVADPRREASSLLEFAIGRPKSYLISHPEYVLSETEAQKFESFTQRRAGREPFQYIAGKQEFFGLDFHVTPAVLIPRPETELLVEKAVELLAKSKNQIFLDIGTGTGCIAISILKNVDSAKAVAVDISSEALAIASANVLKHGVNDRIDLRRSDLFSDIAGLKFDLIASNPPYIPASEMDLLQAEVRDYEPRISLTDGGDGLSRIKAIIQGAPDHLLPGGKLLIEIGFGQADPVSGFMDHSLWKTFEILPDLQGIQRVFFAQIR
ncbi:MAG: peptide chain release factor N(5)-glutamine methyltransferase [Blastocatellia bacterium]